MITSILSIYYFDGRLNNASALPPLLLITYYSHSKKDFVGTKVLEIFTTS